MFATKCSGIMVTICTTYFSANCIILSKNAYCLYLLNKTQTLGGKLCIKLRAMEQIALFSTHFFTNETRTASVWKCVFTQPLRSFFSTPSKHEQNHPTTLTTYIYNHSHAQHIYGSTPSRRVAHGHSHNIAAHDFLIFLHIFSPI